MEHQHNTTRKSCIKTHLMAQGMLDVLSDIIVTYDYHFEGRCYRFLEGHKDHITYVTESHDGKIITASRDKTLKIWDPDTGQCQFTLNDHTGTVDHVIVLPDNRIVSASKSRNDHILRIWNPMIFHTKASSYICQHMAGHTNSITCLEMSDDDQCPMIFSGSYDNTIGIWDTRTLLCKHILIGHTGYICAIKNLSKTQIVTSGDDKTLRIWDTNSGQCNHCLTGTTNDIIMTFNNKIIGVDNSLLGLWDISDEEINCDIIDTHHTWWIEDIFLLSQDQDKDQRLVTVSIDGTLKIWNMITKECEIVHNTNYNKIIMLPDQRLIGQFIDFSFTIFDLDNEQTEQILADFADVSIGNKKCFYRFGINMLKYSNSIATFCDNDVMIWR